MYVEALDYILAWPVAIGFALFLWGCNLSREKRRRIRGAKMTAFTAKGERRISLSEKDHNSMKRKSNRFRTNGIVALTGLEEPVLSNIYDIGSGGVSFLHADEIAIDNVEFKMDILIYDSLTGFEYFISQVKGRVVWRELVSDPENNIPDLALQCCVLRSGQFTAEQAADPVQSATDSKCLVS